MLYTELNPDILDLLSDQAFFEAGHTGLVREKDGETLLFDGVTSLRVDPSGTISQHPGESAQQIADHMVINPTSFTLTASVCNTSLAPSEDGLGVSNAFPDQTENRIQRAIDFFVGSQAEVVALKSGVMEPVYGLVIEGWAYDYSTFDSVQFNLRLKTVRIAQTTTVAAIEPTKTSNGLSPTKDDGNQEGEEADTEEVQRGSVWWNAGNARGFW
jgi:hypothetical protein